MQLMLPMLTVYTGPRLVDVSVISAITTYRDAVRMCWDLRADRRLSKRELAARCGCYASHVTDYLKDGPSSRNLPAEHIAAFERECHNRVISQWLARRAELTILEQFIEQRRDAA